MHSFDLADASVLLVTPPPTPGVTPFGALGYLSGALSHANVSNTQVDLGLELTRWLLEGSGLEQHGLPADHLLEVVSRAGTESKMQVAEFFAEKAAALPVLRSSYREKAAHEHATHIVRSAYALLSDSGSAGRMILGSYDHPWPNIPLEEIQHELLGSRDMLSSFLTTAAEAASARQYRLIAISVAHADQLLPALGFAKALRHAGFEKSIAIGGVQISFLSEELRRTPSFFLNINCALPRMGEDGIVALARAIEEQKPLSSVPGIIVMDRREIAPMQIPGYSDIDIRQLPDPDYTSLPLDAYLAPEPTLPIRTATKCYWGKCNFCRITSNIQFQSKSIITGRTLFEKIKRTMARHDARHFVMADDATSPRTLSAMSKLIISEGLNVSWTCIGMRPEETLTDDTLELWKRAGCASIAIGFESGSQRLVDIMAKGQRVETVERILRSCHRQEIITFCYGFYGHPLETEEDLRASLEFRRRNENYASYFAAGRWMLSPYNLDYHQTKKLDIEISIPNVFPWGREYWLEWTSPRRENHERAIARLLSEFGGVGGPRNYLSDWVYWGQGMHVPYGWVRNASRGAI